LFRNSEPVIKLQSRSDVSELGALTTLWARAFWICRRRFTDVQKVAVVKLRINDGGGNILAVWRARQRRIRRRERIWW